MLIQHPDVHRSRPEKVKKEKAVSFEGSAEEGLDISEHFLLTESITYHRFLLVGVR